MKSRFGWFIVFFAGAGIMVAFLSKNKSGNRSSEELIMGMAIPGFIMLAFSLAGFLGMPMKGNADPRDVACGAIGVLAMAGLIYLFG
jgi:hypothetical protein